MLFVMLCLYKVSFWLSSFWNVCAFCFAVVLQLQCLLSFCLALFCPFFWDGHKPQFSRNIVFCSVLAKKVQNLKKTRIALKLRGKYCCFNHASWLWTAVPDFLTKYDKWLKKKQCFVQTGVLTIPKHMTKNDQQIMTTETNWKKITKQTTRKWQWKWQLWSTMCIHIPIYISDPHPDYGCKFLLRLYKSVSSIPIFYGYVNPIASLFLLNHVIPLN